MIRRLSTSWPTTFATLAVVGAITISAAGCSTFTDNDVAAEYSGHSLSVEDFQTLAGDLVPTDEIGEFLGDDSRSVLGRWITAGLLGDALSTDGVVVDDAARQAAEEQLSQSATWADNAEFTRDFLIRELAAQNAVAVDVAPLSDDELRSLYEAGASSTGVLCMRVIGAQTAEQLQEVTDRLAAGDAFADIADDLRDPSIDAATVPPGGIYLDPDTGSECISAPEGIRSQFTGPLDEVVGPIDGGNGVSIFILQRPFDEIASTLRSLADSSTASQESQARPAKIDELVAVVAPDADVSIDSRYGMWDSETATVVPTR